MSRRLCVPVGAYLAVVLGLPWLNGGYLRPAFYQHALHVLLWVGFAVAIGAGVRACLDRRRRWGAESEVVERDLARRTARCGPARRVGR